MLPSSCFSTTPESKRKKISSLYGNISTLNTHIFSSLPAVSDQASWTARSTIVDTLLRFYYMMIVANKTSIKYLCLYADRQHHVRRTGRVGLESSAVRLGLFLDVHRVLRVRLICLFTAGNVVGSRKRGTLIISCLIQAIMPLLTAGLVQAVIMAGIPRQTQRGQIVTGISYCAAGFPIRGPDYGQPSLGFQ